MSRASQAAQANANYFGVPYVVFIDTSGNTRIERYDANLSCHHTGEVFHPKGGLLDVRRRKCLSCDHEWVERVKYGSHTTISGELRVWCPECRSGNVLSHPIERV